MDGREERRIALPQLELLNPTCSLYLCSFCQTAYFCLLQIFSLWIKLVRLRSYSRQHVLLLPKEAIARILLDNPNLDNSFISPILVKIISEKAKITISKSSKRKRIETPECPVCFENFNSGQQVWQCSKGHFVCEDCVSGIQSCPQCRGRIVGRSFGFENFLTTLDV